MAVRHVINLELFYGGFFFRDIHSFLIPLYSRIPLFKLKLLFLLYLISLFCPLRSFASFLLFAQGSDVFIKECHLVKCGMLRAPPTHKLKGSIDIYQISNQGSDVELYAVSYFLPPISNPKELGLGRCLNPIANESFNKPCVTKNRVDLGILHVGYI